MSGLQPTAPDRRAFARPQARTSALAAVLAGAGFTPLEGGLDWSRRGLRFSQAGPWSELSRTRAEDGDPLRARLGPGLWKPVGGRMVFDLPPGVADPELLGPALDWARATASGSPLRDWRAPTEEELAAELGGRELLVRSGTALVRGELEREPRRLVLGYELATAGPAPSPARLAWIETLLGDAQECWRLVRWSLSSGGERARAEVDLSGLPDQLLGSLLRAAADALAHVVGWLLAPLSLLFDGEARSGAFDRHLPINPHPERKP